MGITKIRASTGPEAYTTRLFIRNHILIADEPVEDGGKNQGPKPYEYLLSGLASCTASTMRMYAERKGWSIGQIDFDLELVIEKSSAGQTSRIHQIIHIDGDLDDEQKSRLIEIAGKCPVNRLLTNNIIIDNKS